MTAVSLTKRERELARHALGLPNQSGRSYRNRFVCTVAPGVYDDWLRMKSKGAAEAMPSWTDTVRFWLTHEGALAALNAGERLDPEDFPAAQRGDGE